MTPKTFQQKQY